jgi:hypothetical protein
MLYDLASGPPAPGSLLESIFLLISVRRREAELAQTQTIITAIVGAAAGNCEAIEASLKEYRDAMFPFLESERTKRAVMAKEALEQWTAHTAFKIRPLWTAHAGGAKKVYSQLRKSAERTQQAEEKRQHTKHTRI